MKNSDKHLSFDDSHFRDSLARKIRFSFDGEVELLTKQINALQEKLKIAIEERYAMELAKSKGWEQFDVSEIISDYDRESYFNFLGSQEEFNSIFKQD